MTFSIAEWLLKDFLIYTNTKTFDIILGYSHPVFDYPLISDIHQSTTNTSAASLAVDGSTDTCAFTNEDHLDNNRWWEVELPELLTVKNVTVLINDVVDQHQQYKIHTIGKYSLGRTLEN